MIIQLSQKMFSKLIFNPQLARGEGRVKGESGQIGRTCQSDRHLGGPSSGELGLPWKVEKCIFMLIAVALHDPMNQVKSVFLERNYHWYYPLGFELSPNLLLSKKILFSF